jgi:protocatechuate 3,4-dioxygenase alpha subunit
LKLPRTPSQTVGPFLALAMRWPPDGAYIVPEDTPGTIWIRGRILDGAGEPVGDAVVETWQPDADGQFGAEADTAFRGFGRVMTDADGSWALRTIKPGRIADARGRLAAPYISVAVFARGLLKPAWTRIYFDDEADANQADSVLQSIDASSRGTLIAESTTDGYRFDVRLQGQDETAFLDV